MSRPSDGFTIEELRDEFDWMFEFDSRMAERIRGDADVHNLVDYVNKLEAENAKLRTEFDKMDKWHSAELQAEMAENAKLRELVAAYDSALHRLCDQTQGHVDCDGCILGKDYRNEDICALDELRDSIMGLGVEVEE